MAHSVCHGHRIGGRWSPVYHSYRAAIRRCEDPKHRSYPNYGGRGIKMYPPWRREFRLFLEYILEHLGDRPDSSYTLDRKDPDKDYEPGNLRWSTATEQRLNQRGQVTFYTYRARTFCAAAWARFVGLKPQTLRSRIKRGMDLLQALNLPHCGLKLRPLTLPPCPKHGADCPSCTGAGDCPDPMLREH